MSYYDIECPYCGAELKIDHDDGYGYEENEYYQQECDECSKIFVYTTFISYDYKAQKADCLNDSNHIFEPTRTYPKEYTKMECVMCGEQRMPTDEEMKEILQTK